jgi:hypothetical protein
MKTTSTIPDVVTVYHFVELLKIVPASRGSRVVRRRLDGAATGGGSSALAGCSSGRADRSSGLVGGTRLAQDLLCSRASKESLNIPNKILLVISIHPKEAELIILGHRMTDLLHLVVGHLAAVGLRSLNGCTEARVSSISGG